MVYSSLLGFVGQRRVRFCPALFRSQAFHFNATRRDEGLTTWPYQEECYGRPSESWGGELS